MLTVDVGNTSIGVGHWRDGVVELVRCASPDEAADLLDAAAGDEAVAITVSQERLARLQDALERRGRPPVRVLTGCPVPVADPRLATTAGADRLAAALAAAPGPAVVVDAGTAVTVEAVGPAGLYRGGFIAPGLGSALEGLARAAPALPRIPGRPVPLAIGLETLGALEAGSFWMVVAGVDRLVEAAAGSLPADAAPVVLATGGWGASWAGASRHAGVRHVADLVHRGIRLWAGRSPR